MKTTPLLLGLLLLLALCAPDAPAARAVEGGDCMLTYAKTRNMDCVDAALAGAAPSPGAKPGQESENLQALVGFLAEVFAASPQERTRVLARAMSPLGQALCIEALWRAGLQQEAALQAKAWGRLEALRRCAESRLAPVRQVRPYFRPADNDLLIGAYMATGDPLFLRNILENFASASELMAGDALRMGLLLNRKDGAGAPERKQITVLAACERYACRADMRNFMRVMTLASASWALDSLGQRDPVIRREFTEFFDKNPRLGGRLAAERQAYAGYLTLLAAQTGRRADPSLDATLVGYEKLGPARDLEAALAKGAPPRRRGN